MGTACHRRAKMGAMRLIIRTVVTATALWVVTLLPLDANVKGGDDGFWSRVLVFLAVGLIVVGVNTLVKPLVKILTLPVQILTLGLFTLIINWAMLWLAAWITTKWDFAVLQIGGFWKTLLAALVVSVVTLILGGMTGVKPK